MITPTDTTQLPARHSGRALSAWLVAELAAAVGADPAGLDVDAPFHRYGLESIQATALMERLSRELGRSVSPVLVWRYPTVRKLAAHLAGEGTADTRAGAERPESAALRANEPIAIVGIACRFPGGADDPGSFWKLLCDGVDATSEVPADRWDVNAYYDADPSKPGKTNVRRGGFLKRVDGFDPLFFGISPREAEQMDPQQRLMLELAWEALEDAGVVPDSVRARRVGVYVGSVFNDYELLLTQRGAEARGEHSSAGSVQAILANRVSYTFGLKGPSLSVNTACSSSLVAVHLACQAIRGGECTMALASGVHLMLAPETTLAVSKFGALSEEGQCRTFDASANGYVRGEGAATVLLKPLSAALRDGDRVYACIRGSAVNNDGATNGLTAPSPEAQEDVMRRALENAGVAASSVDYVELHGTGTALGDPIEASALAAVYGHARATAGPLRVGSVKTNVGHLEAAAGIAGLVKAALCVHHAVLPPSLHFAVANPHIDFAACNLDVVTSLSELRATEGPLRVGVSSFGFGGTNAHVVLERAAARPFLARPFAAPSASRAVAFGQDEEALSSRVVALASGKDDVGYSVRGDARGILPLRPVFAYAGLGPQWVGMGRRLAESEPLFRAVLEECCAMSGTVDEGRLFDVLYSDLVEDADRHDVINPLIVALEIATTALFRSWGVVPGAVIGHSIGEIAAAEAAGILSRGDAMRVAGRIGQAYRASVIAGGGLLAFVALPPGHLRSALRLHQGRVFIAGRNDPSSCAISGYREDVETIVDRLRREGVFTRVLSGVYAHGPHAAPFAAEIAPSLRDIRPRAGHTPFFSTTLARFSEGQELGPKYWQQNVVSPVSFTEGIVALAGLGHSTFLELSPHAVLSRSVAKTLGPNAVVVAAQLRDLDGREAAVRAVAELYVRGADVDWDRVDGRASALAERAGEALLPLSAHTPEALGARARDLVAWLDKSRERGEEPGLGDLAFTLATHREALPHRLTVTTRSLAELRDKLDAFSSREVLEGVAVGRASKSSPRIAFVYSGQGSQWLGMGRALYESEPVFRAAVDQCAQVLLEQVGWCPVAEMYAAEDTSRLEAVDVIQPMIFVVQVALSALLRSWGIEPAVVVGHSMGEVAAACVAGHLPLPHAVRVITQRSGIARQRSSGTGAMAVVELGAEAAARLIAGREHELSVAVSTGPSQAVLSGVPTALDAVLATLEQQGVWFRRVKVDYASHSPLMDALKPELEAALTAVCGANGAVPFFSTVTGERIPGERLEASYWVDNLRRPVRFAESIQALAAEGFDAFVEVSPHPVVVQAIRQNLDHVGSSAIVVGTGKREGGERLAALTALGALHTLGASVRWAAVLPEGGRRLRLPTYPWQRERYWLAPAEAPKSVTTATAAATTARVAAPDGAEWRYQLTWTPVALGGGEVPTGAWLLLGAGAGVRDALVALVGADGQAIVSLDMPEPEGLSREVLARAVAQCEEGGQSLAGVVFVSSLDGTLSEAEGDLPNARAACATVLHLVQAVAGRPKPPRLWMVTRGAWPVAAGDSVERPGQGALWGFGRTIANEHPELRPRLVDLDPGASQAADLSALRAALACSTDEDQLAVRGSAWHGLRLAPAPVLMRLPQRMRADGTYWITGGLGGLGLIAAEWLVERGARHLALTGRSAPSAQAQAVMGRLEASGAEVVVVRGDVGVREDVERMVGEIRGKMPPLRGVIHAAGVLASAVIVRQDQASFDRVFAPKALAAWHLHRATSGDELDLFVQYSSMAAVFGFPGLASSAAANAALDALAWLRHSCGLPAMSVNWGAWEGDGVAADVRRREGSLDVAGLQDFDVHQGKEALASLVAQPLPQVSAHLIDWAALSGHRIRSGNRSPLLAWLHTPTGTMDIAVAPPSAVLALVAAAKPTDRRRVVEDHVRQTVARILGLRSSHPLDPDQGLFDLGFGSLMAVELRSQLAAAFEHPMPATLAFDRPTVRAIAGYLIDTVPALRGVDDPPGEVVEACRLDEDTARIQSLSEADAEEELWALLAETAQSHMGPAAVTWAPDAE
jgi:acyl transferase domain-containing protein/acyl carrier protein